MAIWGGKMGDVTSINLEKDRALVSLNPKIYSKEVIFAASYILLDKAYFLLDGDPKEQIIVDIRPKEGQDIKKIADQFNDELVNYSVYHTQSEKNKKLRQMLLQRALLTASVPQPAVYEDDEEFDDPEGIAIPWEEKYGDKKRC